MKAGTRWRAVLYAAVAAAIASTLVELAAWWILADDPYALFWRDVRFAAALVLGPRVLVPATRADAGVLLTACAVHVALSLAYAAALARLIRRWRGPRVLAAGAAFGLAVYALNMYAMTRVFPWFAADRDAVALAAHAVFGIVAAGVYRWNARRAPA